MIEIFGLTLDDILQKAYLDSTLSSHMFSATPELPLFSNRLMWEHAGDVHTGLSKGYMEQGAHT